MDVMILFRWMGVFAGYPWLALIPIAIFLFIGVAANYRVQSGFSYTRVIQIPVPNLGTVGFFADDIKNHRSDTVPILDLRLDKSIRFGGHYRLQAMLDLFNATNSNAVTNFTMVNGSSYNKIIAALDPRVLQFGFRFDF